MTAELTRRRFYATLKYGRTCKQEKYLKRTLLKLFQYAYTCGWADKMEVE